MTMKQKGLHFWESCQSYKSKSEVKAHESPCLFSFALSDLGINDTTKTICMVLISITTLFLYLLLQFTPQNNKISVIQLLDPLRGSSQKVKEKRRENKKQHGLHGAWCWYKVANKLKSEGHNVTTLDMAACGVNPKQRQEVNSVSEYNEPLMAFMASLPPEEKVILVGHSLGGLSASIAMENYPEKISVAVFITATVVSQNLTYPAFLQERRRRLISLNLDEFFILDGVNKAPILSSLGVELLASRFYQLTSNEDLTLVFSLVRPLPPITSDVKLLMKQTAVTKHKNGRVSKVFIISEKDNLHTEDFQRWIIESTGPYAEVKVIKDSDHMVMFSKPKKLSFELLKIAYKY